MIIAYDSRTGNVQRFVDSLGVKAVKIREDLVLDQKFILITYTTGFGQASPLTMKFLEKNSSNLVGVASSGNRNWGNNFCKAADIISETYKVPVIMKFELSGTKEERENFKIRVMSVETH